MTQVREENMRQEIFSRRSRVRDSLLYSGVPASFVIVNRIAYEPEKFKQVM